MLKKSLIFLSTSSLATVTSYGIYKNRLPSDNKFHIALDLDSTLIYASKQKRFINSNMKNVSKPHCILNNDNEDKEQYHVWLRPFCIPSLMFLSSFNNLHLFTKAKQPYANEICEKTGIEKYLTSKSHAENSNEICKDLNLILPGVKDNMKLLVDDNNVNNCTGQKLYHIPNYSYLKQYDFELPILCLYIIKLNLINDIGSFSDWCYNFTKSK